MGLSNILTGVGAAAGIAAAPFTGGASLAATIGTGALGAFKGASLGNTLGSIFEGGGGRSNLPIPGQPNLPQGTNLASSTPSFDFGQGGQTIAPQPGIIGTTIAQPREDPFLAEMRRRIGLA